MIDSGLSFEIQDDGGRGIDYAIVRGPGLPAGGILFVNYTRNGSFGAASGPYRGERTPRLLTKGNAEIPLSDAVIASLSDTAAYTIELYDNRGTVEDTTDDTLLATYTSAITKRPYMVSELSVSSFAQVTAPSRAQLRSFAQGGGTVIATWTLPAGMAASSLHFFRSGSMGGFDTVDVNLTTGATSATLSIGAPAPGFGTVQGAGFNLYISDAFGRELITIYNAN